MKQMPLRKTTVDNLLVPKTQRINEPYAYSPLKSTKNSPTKTTRIEKHDSDSLSSLQIEDPQDLKYKKSTTQNSYQVKEEQFGDLSANKNKVKSKFAAVLKKKMQ